MMTYWLRQSWFTFTIESVLYSVNPLTKRKTMKSENRFHDSSFVLSDSEFGLPVSKYSFISVVVGTDLKFLWSKNCLFLIWKLFQRKQEWRFLVLNIFTRSRDIEVSCSKLDDDTNCFSTKKIHHKIKNISGNIEVMLLKLGTSNGP